GRGVAWASGGCKPPGELPGGLPPPLAKASGQPVHVDRLRGIPYYPARLAEVERLFASRWRMVWRKWVVRGLVFCALGGLTLGAALYQYLTNPEAVRRQVLARLRSDLVGVHVSLDSARLRLFGGIAVQELRLS